MTKLLAPTLESAKIAARLRKSVGGRLPQPVDADGNTPRLWSACTAYVVDEADDITADDQDLVVAIATAPGKVRAQDGTAAKVKARLTAELAKAKTDREAGKKPGRIVKQRGGERW